MILCHILINAKLKNPISYYESIKKIDFKKYDKKVKNAVIASVLNTETKDVNIEIKQDHLLNLIILGDYAKRLPKCSRISKQKLM